MRLPRYPRAVPDVVLCLDVGSTYTKGLAVDLRGAHAPRAAEHRTTSDTTLMDGIAAVRDQLGLPADIETLACSSAGGGLRLAVIGYEPEISAEAGHRVALSAGARVVLIAAGRLDREGLTELAANAPDVLLLVGGTDGGEGEVLLHNATRLARSRLRVPVVVAGNSAVREAAIALFAVRRRTVIGTENVIPDIGLINPAPARAAIRTVFLRHVIGGKRLSRDPAFVALVRAVTPDAVLDGVGLLGAVLRERDPGSRGVVVLDVGGATTDVYSSLVPELPTAAVPTLADRRTVEGDLGMRWSAEALLDAAEGEGLDTVGLPDAAHRRSADVAMLPETAADSDEEARLAGLAAILALRRHVRAEEAYAAGSASARGVGLVVLSGGVFRHLDRHRSGQVIEVLRADRGGARAVLDRARVVVDDAAVLGPAGLLAGRYPEAARRLVAGLLEP